MLSLFQSNERDDVLRGEDIEELKTLLGQLEEKLMGRFEELEGKLGCEEEETLMEELHELLVKEVRPLRDSFREVYSKVFTPQIKEHDVRAATQHNRM